MFNIINKSRREREAGEASAAPTAPPGIHTFNIINLDTKEIEEPVDSLVDL